MIVVVDAGLGNVTSIVNMFDRVGVPALRQSSPEGLSHLDRFVLPGVGAFDEGVRLLRAAGWFDFLASLPTTTHVLGICLGMQLLGRGSEEGQLGGLGRVPMEFERFDVAPMRVPHMGWNIVESTSNDPIFDPEFGELRYYFTHSYRAQIADESIEIGKTTYGVPFSAAVRVGNTRGVQFHPEKSHRFGMSLLKRWAEL